MEVHPILAYVAGPYRDPRGPWFIRQNIRQAEEIALKLWQAGVPALCPHKNTALFDGAAPDEVWLEGDLLMMARCDVVIVGPDWTRSSGTAGEVRKAGQWRIPVYHYATQWERFLDDLERGDIKPRHVMA